MNTLIIQIVNKSISFHIILWFVVFACQSPRNEEDQVYYEFPAWDETEEIQLQQQHTNERMRFKLLQSKYQQRDFWNHLNKELNGFNPDKYEVLRELILEKDIPDIQNSIEKGKLTYEELTLFYLYRIRHYESDPSKATLSIISLNSKAVEEARKRDKEAAKINNKHPLYGMPVLVKDNIGTDAMPTTAGAIALADNYAKDAFIISRLKEHGAIILGKTNLSEWAYFFCDGCPLGYSAVGGQTLNPYGRKVFESGGSSSGSGVAVALNYATAAIGTETSGSILSPSSLNSVVGLKPTVGMLSRIGIVPISGTLDTPGPMAKNVSDAAILFSAMMGYDDEDPASRQFDLEVDFYNQLSSSTLGNKRIGVLQSLLDADTLYNNTVKIMHEAGASVIVIEPPLAPLDGFLNLLITEMKNDLPIYLESQASENITFKNIDDIRAFNNEDIELRAPYGQKWFESMVADSTDSETLEKLKSKLSAEAIKYFETPMLKDKLDAFLSVNNMHAAYAAVAFYPCLTLPMGFRSDGSPANVTFISPSGKEKTLFELAWALEKIQTKRKPPAGFLY
ncbi:MAG: amidase [Cyclobacteriaceae bacterium]|nr:amidase [Cyclobacteriaceae bacterium]